MKITRVTSYVLRHGLPDDPGIFRRFGTRRTALPAGFETDEGVTGLGTCVGSVNVAVADEGIVAKVTRPVIPGDDPIDRDVIRNELRTSNP